MVIVGEEALSSTEAPFYWKPLRKIEGEEARTFYRLPRGSGWWGGGGTVAQKGYTCKLKMLLQTKNFTYKLKIGHAN